MIEALKSDKGNTRDTNQDYLTFSTNKNGARIYILCDGMGGYKGGEVASLECSRFIEKQFVEAKLENVDEAKKWLYETILQANKEIQSLAKKNSEFANMGTTIVCLLVTSEFRVYANVGDSRIYAYNHRELVQLSEDQTFANALLKAGYISQKEAKIHPKKNLLLCAIGTCDDDLDVQINEASNKYNYLLCSDGLYNMIENKEILRIINSDEDINNRAQCLINVANQNGGRDNVSVILVEGSL